MNQQISIVIPIKDGERYLSEVLSAIQAEDTSVEVLLIDSGSTDSSLEIARRAKVRVVEIPSEEFGHGKTRNLGAELTAGELICFLTQDATPKPGWIKAFRSAFAQSESIGVAYGPHLPRPDTSPMIARELTEFFTAFSPDGEPVIQDGSRDGSQFLSNVNACYRRDCWEQVRFRDLPYAEDQQFARDMAEHGWLKLYHPQAAVLHAHDYSPINFMRRYFDEYRGLRETVGHVEPIALRSFLGNTRNLVRADQRWMHANDYTLARSTYWTGRSLLHHSSRKAFAVLGSRASTLPGWLESKLSLERRSSNNSLV